MAASRQAQFGGNSIKLDLADVEFERGTTSMRRRTAYEDLLNDVQKGATTANSAFFEGLYCRGWETSTWKIWNSAQRSKLLRTRHTPLVSCQSPGLIFEPLMAEA